MQGAAQQYLLFRRFADMAAPLAAKAEDAEVDYKLPPQSVGEQSEVAADTLTEEEEDQTAFWVDVALQAEEIALTEWKEEQARLLKEREELLRQLEKEREEREAAERESIRSSVDNTPATYDAYTPPVFEERQAPDLPPEEAEEPQEEDSVVLVKSFAAKLRVADDEIKEYYCAISNALLS